LTRNQTLVFVIAITGLLITSLAWFFPEFWSKHPSVEASQIRLRKVEFHPPENGKPILVDVLYENYGTSSLEVATRSRVWISSSKVSAPIPIGEWLTLDESLWKEFISTKKDAPKLTVPYDSKPWVTVPGPEVTPTTASDLLSATGRSRISIVGRFEWESDGRAHKYDFCFFTFGDVVFSCQHHNGP
jgi:hypothetical protein